MLFNSVQFLTFLPVVLTAYHLLSHKAQNRFLLAASCFFYAMWDWRFLAPLLISTTIDYCVAVRLEDLHRCNTPTSRAHMKRYVALSVVTNLSLLGFFKYFNFFVNSAQGLLSMFGFTRDLWALEVILPVGISFYTFQALSYTIDVYRGRLHATRSFPDFLLCVIYFPHLVAGPIQRAHSLLAQVTHPRQVTAAGIVAGLHLIIWGYFKKVFIADNLSPLVQRVFGDPSPDGYLVLVGVYAFAFQIYCDFSGYTDIARGVAKLMGFDFMLNFNLPYLATNPREFWNRWHISLSTWLRDYLYVPLGGNRYGEWMTYRNLMLTMVIGGFWHGAAWTFIIWGFYHGLLLVLHRYFQPVLERIFAARTSVGAALSRGIALVLFFQLVCYGWLIFRAESFSQLTNMTRALLRPGWDVDPALFWRVTWTVAPLMAVQLIQAWSKRLDFLDFPWITPEWRSACYAVLLYLLLFRGGQPESFIYFQF